MKQPGPNFLTGAGFTRYQNGAADIRGAFDMARNATDLSVLPKDPTLWIFWGERYERFN
jgi:hypothetical protein